MRRLYAVLLVAILSGCAATDSRTPLPWAGYDETIAIARHAGVDYVALTRRCLAHDLDAMHRLFLLTRDAGFDGASSEGHAEVLGRLLRHMGDDFFGRALAREEDSVRAAVLVDLRYDAGEDVPPESFAYLYPITSGKRTGI